jgi:hypothetical protein
MKLLFGAAALTLVTGSFAQPQPKSNVNWKAQLPAIEAVLRSSRAAEELSYPIAIREEVDLTGDGSTEALVFTGSGGAYTSEYILMRMDGVRPVAAQFKEANGKVGPARLWEGSSVMHGLATELHPEQHAVLQIHGT